MNPASPFNQNMLTPTPEPSSMITLIERGLDYLQQGKDIEAISLFELVRKQIALEQPAIVQMLDMFLMSYARYREAQKAFHEANRRFAEADMEQQHLSQSVVKLLLSLHKEAETPTFAPINQLSHEQQVQQAFQSPSSSTSNIYDQLQAAQSATQDSNTLPPLSITMFRNFEVRREGQPIALCQNRNGQAILRYLLAQPGHRASLDTLMEILWPEDEAEVARHKVQVAVSALRNSLNQGLPSRPCSGYILFKNGVYQLNPAVSLISDVEQFLVLYQRGRQSNGEETMMQYEQACRLYTGPFLVEDLYADWSIARREQLCQYFITMCRALADHYLSLDRYEEAEQRARAALNENRCDEESHRQLIRIYLAQGQRSEAIRQYQICERILTEELGILPMTETVTMLNGILIYEHALQNRANIERQ